MLELEHADDVLLPNEDSSTLRIFIDPLNHYAARFSMLFALSKFTLVLQDTIGSEPILAVAGAQLG